MPKKNIDKILTQYNTKYGKTGQRIGYANDIIIPPRVINTSLDKLEEAIGIGGMPFGGVIELYGQEHIGKSFMAQVIVAEAQKCITDKSVVYFDFEFGLSEKRMEEIGIKTDELLMSRIINCEDAFEQFYHLAENEAISMAVFDSVAAMRTRDENEGDVGSPTFKRAAGVLSTELPKMISYAAQHGIMLLFINQIRDDMNTASFRKSTHTTGGKSLKFYSHLRIEIKPDYENNDMKNFKIIDSSTKKFIGQNVACRVVKNRYAAPENIAYFPIYVGEPDLFYEVIAKGRKEKFITTRLGSFTYKDEEGNKHTEIGEPMFLHMMAVTGKIRELKNRLKELPASFDNEAFELQIQQRIEDVPDDEEGVA